MIILFTIITFFSTLVGGLFALRFKDKLHLVLGFSAGAVIGTVFFELLPESLSLGIKYISRDFILVLTGVGFFIYMLLDKMSLLHSSAKDKHTHNHGDIGAGSLSLHSFFDGIAIGLSFQISKPIGIIIALAVIVHDFSDGLNTVSIVLKNKGDSNRAFKWLLVDSIAPVIGVVSTQFFILSPQAFVIVLSLFSGFFLYIGASDLLPESQFEHPSLLTTFITIAGAATIYMATHILAT